MTTTYQLSPGEFATAQIPLGEIAKQQQVLSFFLSHVMRERGLPEIEGGYMLSQDGKALVPARPQPPPLETKSPAPDLVLKETESRKDPEPVRQLRAVAAEGRPDK